MCNLTRGTLTNCSHTVWGAERGEGLGKPAAHFPFSLGFSKFRSAATQPSYPGISTLHEVGGLIVGDRAGSGCLEIN